MKYLKYFEIFGLNQPKEGDAIIKRLLDIIKKENINVQKHPNGNYGFTIDNKTYTCIAYQTGITLDCVLSINNKSYKFSTKFWYELKKIAKEQENLKKDTDISNELDELTDIVRASKKYNL